MKFKEVLTKFKSKESENSVAEGLAPLTGDKTLRDGMIAWQSMIVDYDPESDCPYPDEENKLQWIWLWKEVKFDHNMFATITGIKPYNAVALVERLKAFRLIYPDGTISNNARSIVRQDVMKHLPKQKKKEKKDATIEPECEDGE